MAFSLYAALFVLGALVASFMGVVAARLHTGQGFLGGRSRCDACAAPLPARALVPILSHVSLRGRAACCGARLPLFSPLSELVLGALFVLAYQAVGSAPVLLPLLISLALLLALVLYDLRHEILPPTLLYPFVLSSAAAGFLADGAHFRATLLVALLMALSFAVIHFLSRGRALGFADIPFVFALALLTGASALPGLVFSFWIGAAVGIVILLRRPRGSRMGVAVPFAPFLAAGFLLAYFTQWNPFLFVAGSL